MSLLMILMLLQKKVVPAKNHISLAKDFTPHDTRFILLQNNSKIMPSTIYHARGIMSPNGRGRDIGFGSDPAVGVSVSIPVASLPDVIF